MMTGSNSNDEDDDVPLAVALQQRKKNLQSQETKTKGGRSKKSQDDKHGGSKAKKQRKPAASRVKKESKNDKDNEPNTQQRVKSESDGGNGSDDENPELAAKVSQQTKNALNSADKAAASATSTSRKRRGQPPIATKNNRPTTKRKTTTKSSMACPHCQKTFATSTGFQYHIRNTACATAAKAAANDVAAVATRKESPAAVKRNPEIYESSVAVSRRRKRRRVNYNEQDDDESKNEPPTDHDDSDQGSFASSPSISTKRRKDSVTSSVAVDTTTTTAGEDERTCPDCHKLFSSREGLTYHLEYFVCRPDLRPGGPVKKGRRKVVRQATRRKRKKGGDDDASSSSSSSSQDGDDDKEEDEEEDLEEDDKPKARKSRKKYKRLRGSLTDRTCPRCQRVFTSTLGLGYHLEKKVCQQEKNQKKNTVMFPVLQPGSKFITKWGVVDVIADNTATPTAELTLKRKEKYKIWSSAKHKIDVQQQKQEVNIAVMNRLRRLRLATLYVNDQLNQYAVFEAYFGRDPRRILPEERPLVALPRKLKRDPMFPEDAFPDRIVECRLVSDSRKRFQGIEDDVGDNRTIGGDALVKGKSETKLYLQRRCLTELYSENAEVYVCQDCGHHFYSRPGAKYHMESKVCCQKANANRLAALKTQETIEERATRLLARAQAPNHGAATQPLPPRLLVGAPKKKHKGNEPVYPQLWLGLGFKFFTELAPQYRVSAFNKASKHPSTGPKLSVGQASLPPRDTMVPASGSPTDAADITQPANVGAVLQPPKPLAAENIAPVPPVDANPNKDNVENDDNWEAPNITLDKLNAQLKYHQSMLLGPIYPDIIKYLKFKKPGPPKPRKVVVTKAKKPKKKKKQKPKKKPTPEKSVAEEDQTLEKSNSPSSEAALATKSDEDNTDGEDAEDASSLPFRPLLPILDVRVLVNEADLGRYPSVKRDSTREHDTHCNICKSDFPTLLPCDYCKNNVHFKCVRTKFIIKDPEPEDIFMCHNCIQIIMARRNRAEKRRLSKLLEHVPTDQAVAEDNARLARELVEGQEYDCVAAQGKQVNDLVELLKDAHLRFTQSLETAKVNSLRRRLIRDILVEENET